MEMKATHKLVELSCGDEWLLRCTGRKHWWCKISGEDADSVWRGPAKFPVSSYREDSKFKLTELDKFKGNK